MNSLSLSSRRFVPSRFAIFILQFAILVSSVARGEIPNILFIYADDLVFARRPVTA